MLYANESLSNHCVISVAFSGAECREHRRWIERNNAKLRERGKKEEGRRLRDFVDAAYRIDPRVTARKEAERLERCVVCVCFGVL